MIFVIFLYKIIERANQEMTIGISLAVPVINAIEPLILIYAF